MTENTKTLAQMIEESAATTRAAEVGDAAALVGRSDVCFVDVRERDELREKGCIPGAEHAPRGMLEFLADPDSPFHREVFARPAHFVVYCAKGGRSLLAARLLTEMGLKKVSYLKGGIEAWRDAGHPVEPVAK